MDWQLYVYHEYCLLQKEMLSSSLPGSVLEEMHNLVCPIALAWNSGIHPS